MLSQLGQRFVAFDGGQGHLGLKGGSVIPSRSFHRLAPFVDHLLMIFVKPGSHLPYCPNFRSPLLDQINGFGSDVFAEDREVVPIEKLGFIGKHSR